MRHVLSGLSTYGLNDQRMGDEHPTYAPDAARPGLPLYSCDLPAVISDTYLSMNINLIAVNNYWIRNRKVLYFIPNSRKSNSNSDRLSAENTSVC